MGSFGSTWTSMAQTVLLTVAAAVTCRAAKSKRYRQRYEKFGGNWWRPDEFVKSRGETRGSFATTWQLPTDGRDGNVHLPFIMKEASPVARQASVSVSRPSFQPVAPATPRELQA